MISINRFNKFNDCKDSNSLNEHLNLVKDKIILKFEKNSHLCPEVRHEKSENKLPDRLGETIVNPEQCMITEHEKDKNSLCDFIHLSAFNADQENYDSYREDFLLEKAENLDVHDHQESSEWLQV